MAAGRPWSDVVSIVSESSSRISEYDTLDDGRYSQALDALNKLSELGTCAVTAVPLLMQAKASKRSYYYDNELSDWDAEEMARKRKRNELAQRHGLFLASVTRTLAAICAGRIDIMFEALHDPDGKVREYAADVLGEIGDPLAVEPLAQALEQPPGDDGYRAPRYAARALGRLQDTRVVGLLLSVLRDHKSARAAAAEALENHTQNDRVRDALIRSLKDQDINVRWGAAIALGSSRHPAAIQALIEVLDDRDGGLRIRAERSLKKSTGQVFSQAAQAK
ncbi:MAG: HEAT repeat domain-containing protein, partial [Deltaproteobacteria bacterium]|nr:HEAT repeat domain-containing protein [Deltaproteobacteria bacterium]